VGLSRFAEMLGIESEDFELHHAIDDSVLSAHILAKVYERESFTTAVRPMNEEFYRRLTFKPSIVKELDDPAVKKEKLIFHCPKCRKPLKETGQWRFFHNRFNAPLQCPVCRGEYYGRVQVRRTFDGPVTKRSLAPKKPKEPEEKKENT
jgi:rubrerythrin